MYHLSGFLIAHTFGGGGTYAWYMCRFCNRGSLYAGLKIADLILPVSMSKVSSGYTFCTVVQLFIKFMFYLCWQLIPCHLEPGSVGVLRHDVLDYNWQFFRNPSRGRDIPVYDSVTPPFSYSAGRPTGLFMRTTKKRILYKGQVLKHVQ